jgi:vacuolar-type H+-ATPase subunit D/Vma8
VKSETKKTEKKMESLAEALPKEQQRVRELLTEYEAIPAGAFGAAMIRQALDRAEIASASGDLAEMIRSYEELKDCQ